MTDNQKAPNNESTKSPKPDRQVAKPYSPYPENTKPNWVWLLPLLLVTLGVGLFAGKLWGEKQANEAAAKARLDAEINEEKSVMPQIATATGITEIDKTAKEEVTVEKTDKTDKKEKETAKNTKKNTDKAAPEKQKPVLTVETVTPTQSVINNALSAEGTISAATTATVNGKVSGVAIEKVVVEEGDYVKKGQVLAVFDNSAMRQRLIQAESELAEAQTSFQLAKRDVERVQPLLELQAVSQQELDRYLAKAAQAEAAVVASKARLGTQEINMGNSKVTAPVSGIISKKSANVGSVPGSDPLFTIIKNGQLEWQAQVDPNKLEGINVGTPVEVSLPNKNSVMGKVSRIAPTTKKGSRQVTIYASLDNSPHALSGMYQSGTFKLGSDAKVTIPVSSVVTSDGYDYVMQVKAIKDENRETIYRISRIKVKLGERNGDRVVLLEPLKGEGHIVRQGGSFLNDGDIVRVAEIKEEAKPKAKK